MDAGDSPAALDSDSVRATGQAHVNSLVCRSRGAESRSKGILHLQDRYDVQFAGAAATTISTIRAISRLCTVRFVMSQSARFMTIRSSDGTTMAYCPSWPSAQKLPSGKDIDCGLPLAASARPPQISIARLAIGIRSPTRIHPIFGHHLHVVPFAPLKIQQAKRAKSRALISNGYAGKRDF